MCSYRSSGIRDDLLCLLDEDLSSIQLCALHMEMRNTEQLLASIGLMAYKVDSLREANDALKGYGPESFHGDRITLKKKLVRSQLCLSTTYMSVQCQASSF